MSIQKVHPLVKQLEENCIHFETPEELKQKFEELAFFYGKEPEYGFRNQSGFFCIKAPLKSVSRNARSKGISSTVAFIRFESVLTRSGEKHRLSYKKGAGSYNELYRFAEKFNININE